MTHKENHTKFRTIFIVCLLLMAGITSQIEFIYPFSITVTTFTGVIRNTLYIVLLLVWAVSLQYRILQNQVKKYLLYAAAALVCWLTVRFAKYYLVLPDSTVCRQLWYWFYFAIIMVPLLGLNAAYRIGQREGQPISFFWKLAYLCSGGLVLFVLTNDFHQMVFRFKPGFENWDSDYTHVWGYYIIILWAVVTLIYEMIVLYRKCTIANSRRRIIIPYLLFLFWVMMACFKFLGLQEMYNMPENYCFIFVSVWESCIQIGLIPSNAGYKYLFTDCSLDAKIVDRAGNVIYSSREIPHSASIEEKSAEISGGKVTWIEEKEFIVQMNQQLEEVHSRLAEDNTLMSAEISLHEREARTKEKAKLYKNITREIQEPISKANALLAQIDESDEDSIKELLPRVCIYGVFVKRYGNLMILAAQKDELPIYELQVTLAESVDYLKLAGIMAGFQCTVEGVLPTNVILNAYRFYERIVELAILDETEAKALMVYLGYKEKTNNVFLRMMLSEYPEDLPGRIEQEELPLSYVSDEDEGTLYLIASLGEGGRPC